MIVSHLVFVNFIEILVCTAKIKGDLYNLIFDGLYVYFILIESSLVVRIIL